MTKKNQIKRRFTAVLMATTMAFTIPTVIPMKDFTMVASAATAKMNKSTLTLKVGDIASLKVVGANGKATWKSSNTSVATVSKSGKVTAVEAGKSTITATIKGKKYTCKVTVKEEGQTVKLGAVQFNIPTDWKYDDITALLGQKGVSLYNLYQKDSAIQTTSEVVQFSVTETGGKKVSMDDVKARLTEEKLKATYSAGGYTVSDYSISNLKSNLGKAVKVEYVLKNSSGSKLKGFSAVLVTDDYIIGLDSYDNESDDASNPVQVAKNILSNLKFID
ncbi:MAG TPA: Ig-like domain-containing protein [Lachnospiraceae bacterium]|nr:Ig-like domain-containing protein [Lachnospiraceae bacterium]